MDFLLITSRSTKRGEIEIFPKFVIKKSEDLMVRGKDFYALWDEHNGRWTTCEYEAIAIIDNELRNYYNAHKDEFNGFVKVLYLWDSSNGMIDEWHKYCQRQTRDSYQALDETIIFHNTPVSKKDYASKKLPYSLEKGSIQSFDRLMSVLYTPEERHKIEWAIGSIVSGDSKYLQKFMVMYGSAGTGKSTVLNIIQDLFEGYYAVFDAKALGSNGSQFALEAFKNNPLVAIQHDGDLSRIEDNTRLNSLVSHETMTVNEKYRGLYTNAFKAFLFMGTNKPVKITDAKSGLIRRLIDVSPSGNLISSTEYRTLVKNVKFELGAIAQHCLDIYLENTKHYDHYIPLNMLGASNDFFNFVEDSMIIFRKENGVTLRTAWELYKQYCEYAKVSFPASQRIFKEELKNYFENYHERYTLENGERVRSYYSGFLHEKFDMSDDPHEEVIVTDSEFMNFQSINSIFDNVASEYTAQLASSGGYPAKKWDKVTSKLKDINTNELHWVIPDEKHVIIDFDIPDENGNKSLEKNIEAAKDWPETYAELSKSGCGIHLHYIYTGDVHLLDSKYGDHIEVKVFKNGTYSALRRKYSKSNGFNITSISSGLPLRKENNMVSTDYIITEKSIRTMISRNLNKEIHSGTKPSIDFINKILNDAFDSGVMYDVSDMKNDIIEFANRSTNQALVCIKIANNMKYSSESVPDIKEDEEVRKVFYDVEVFPNLFIIGWKFQNLDGVKEQTHIMINPSIAEIEPLLKYNLIGFNNRDYDNHILYAARLGYSNEMLYELSQRIIGNVPNAKFREAYNISYTDIYDYALKKQSLKKWQIELGLHHLELGLPWDQPVPVELWKKVGEYCAHDVESTEDVFNATSSDFVARLILADLAGMSTNAKNNTLTTKIILGNTKDIKKELKYRDMGEVPDELFRDVVTRDNQLITGEYIDDPDYTVFDKDGKPIFPGYKYSYGVSTYRGIEVGEGGYVYAKPGIYENVGLLDIASMHPTSVREENLFGAYTEAYFVLVDIRLLIKHGKYDEVRSMMGGKLAKYLTDESKIKQLSNALKTPINAIYGLTSAKFDNAFRDKRNVDNIVAKRGALFMVNLQKILEKRGIEVCHIKTDSVKIPNITPEIAEFVMTYGKMYGYTFEWEATYEKMALVNNAVYIAKDEDGWHATGTQFKVPYVFKKLFSKEEITLEDRCEVRNVVKGTIFLDNNEHLEDVSALETELQNRIYNNVLYNNAEIDEETRKKRRRSVKKVYEDYTNEELRDIIDKNHNYIFVGKVGNFMPVLPGHGGCVMVKQVGDKYDSVAGTQGYRWKEAEVVAELNEWDLYDDSYHEELVRKAIETISEYGDFDKFAA